MILTLQQINIAMRVYNDVSDLLLPAEMTFKISKNYEMLRDKNDLFVSKLLLIANEYHDDREKLHDEIVKWSNHEIDLSIEIIGNIHEFRNAVIASKENKLKPNTLNAIRFMFDKETNY